MLPSFMGRDDRKIPEIKFFDINNGLISFPSIKNKTLLILFFDPLNTFHKERLVYAQVIQCKYGSSEFEVIGICNNHENACRELFGTGKFSFPFAFDKGGKIQRAFGVNECCGGTVLISGGKTIKFQSSLLLNNENLRQLVEREIKGSIAYDFPSLKTSSIPQIKQKLEKMTFIDFRSGKIRQINNLASADYVLLTFFSGLCPSCKSGGRIGTLRKLETAFILNQIKAKLIIIFPQPFNERDINEWEKLVSMPFDKYISSEEMFSDEEKYITDSSKKIEPLSVVLDKERNIIYAERFGLSEDSLFEEIMSLFFKTRKPR